MSAQPETIAPGVVAVQRLIARQFPQWVHEPVARAAGAGTVNAVFRIGASHAARFPLHDADPASTSAHLQAEQRALSALAAATGVPVPLPVALGRPGEGYPLPWSVQTWLAGAVATPHSVARSVPFALDLVALIRDLRSADAGGRRFDGAGRGGDLRRHDEWMETCFRRSGSLLPVGRLRAAWSALRELPRSGDDVMTHGDLTPGNLLVERGRLTGVLDGGGFGPADRALDLVAVWHLLDAEARTVVREALRIDDVEWRRGAAWALEQSMGLVWYHRTSNPTMAGLGRSTIHRLLSDLALGL